jgi:hypothetical protein
MQLKKYFVLMLAALVLTMTAMPSLAQAPTGPGAGLTVPVQGIAKGAGRVTGTFTIHRFVDNNGQLGALGTLVLNTASRGTVVTQVVMPVVANTLAADTNTSAAVAIQAVCSILDLTLGPLDLNLLGLVIHLDTVHLDIDADPAGGLLGQLLSGLGCGTLGISVLTLLNQILAILGGILAGI